MADENKEEIGKSKCFMIGDTFCHLWPNHVAPKSGINRSQCIVRNSQGAFFVRPAGRISIVRECVKLLD